MQQSISENALWARTGLVLGRTAAGNGSHVVGDPCVVWDPELSGWRMILFFDPPGHGMSVSMDPTAAPGTWSEAEPLRFTNPEALPADGGGTHKPFVVMDANHPNAAAVVDGKYWLVTVSFRGDAREKRVQRAWATSLAGPWTLEEGELIPRGAAGEFDENHADAVSGFWFEDQQQFLYFYMGYPLDKQPWPNSPYGNAIGVVSQRLGERAIKRGVALAPSEDPEHWTAGYLGGLQLMPGTDHRWVAIINGSPSAPDRLGNMTSEEPAPSLGGWAFTDSEFPLDGWVASDQPLERIEDIPVTALADGEGVNFWRHHFISAGGVDRIFYNSGTYGTEQMYSKVMVPAESVGSDGAV
jgi:hypothetical protein